MPVVVMMTMVTMMIIIMMAMAVVQTRSGSLQKRQWQHVQPYSSEANPSKWWWLQRLCRHRHRHHHHPSPQ